MSTQQPAAPVERITYGNLRLPRRPGVLGMGMAASILVGVAAVIVVINLMAFGLIAAAVALLVAVLVLTPMIAHGPDGHSGYQRLLGRVVFRHSAKAGRTVYLAGATGQTPDGRTRLPGLLAQTELAQAVDAYGDAYGVIVTPGVDHYSVTMASEASGNDLVDQPVTDSAVAHWGGWIAQLGQEPDVVAAAVTIETAPDPGTRLVRMVKRHTQDTAPEFSAATLDEITTAYPAASSTTTTRIAMTFSSRPRPGEDRRSQQDMLAYLGRRLPGFRAGLKTTGAGTTVRMMSAADLTDAVRVC